MFWQGRTSRTSHAIRRGLLLAQLVALADAAAGEAKKPKWGPDNPKPFILKYQKYVGPFMAMRD